MEFYRDTIDSHAEASPFTIVVGDLSAFFTSMEAFPFIITDTRVLFGPRGSEHYNVESKLFRGEEIKVEGRVWLDCKAVAFWKPFCDGFQDCLKRLEIALRKRLGIDTKQLRIFADFHVVASQKHPRTLFVVKASFSELQSLQVYGNPNEFFYDLMVKKEKLTDAKTTSISNNGMLNRNIWRHYQNLDEVRYLNPNIVPQDDGEIEHRVKEWCRYNRANCEKLQEKNGVLIFKLDLSEDENENELRNRLSHIFFPLIKFTLKKRGAGIFLIAVKDFDKEAPVMDSETIRVYHGTDISKALVMLKKGFSGKERVQRVYSDEVWNNPAGLFVTINFDKAKYFATNNRDSVIIEFTARVSDLDRPVWGGDTHSYVTYGGVSGVFRNRAERQIEKRRQHNDAMASNYSYVKNSDSPATIQNLTIGAEQQALYFGDMEPNMIKRVWVKEGASFVPYDRKGFLSRYGQHNSYLDPDRMQEFKLYSPSEDYTGIEDFSRRWDERYPKFKGAGEEFLNGVWDNINNDNGNISYSNSIALKQIMWPKQLEQFLTTGGYQQNIDNMYPEFRQSGNPW